MNLNNEFLNEFKKLDKLLSDAYGEIHGVTAYINDMDDKGLSLHDDYKRLKTLRNIRNKLIHEVGYDEIERVTNSDISYLKSFYNRFLKGNDPLAKKITKSTTVDENNATYIGLVVAIIALVAIIAGVLINQSL